MTNKLKVCIVIDAFDIFPVLVPLLKEFSGNERSSKRKEYVSDFLALINRKVNGEEIDVIGLMSERVEKEVTNICYDDIEDVFSTIYDYLTSSVNKSVYKYQRTTIHYDPIGLIEVIIEDQTTSHELSIIAFKNWLNKQTTVNQEMLELTDQYLIQSGWNL